MEKMNIVITAIIAFIVVGAVIAYNVIPGISGNAVKSNTNSTPAVNITYDNLASVMSKNSMIKAVPKDTDIVLKFYNFNSGQRQWEKSFLMSDGKITETSNDATGEIVLTIHSKYMKGLTNKNFCSVIRKADKNGDLGFETELTNTQLLWKFKSMAKYKSCLGL